MNIIYFACLGGFLSVCLFVSNKRQNGWTNLAQIICVTSHDPREGLRMIECLKFTFNRIRCFQVFFLNCEKLFTIELEDGSETGILYLINCNENIYVWSTVLKYTGWVLRRLVKNCTFFVQLSWIGVYNIFWRFVFFLLFQWPIKYPRTFFSLKIKSSVKQKCVNKLFLLKPKILKRLNHRIAENLPNCK